MHDSSGEEVVRKRPIWLALAIMILLSACAARQTGVEPIPTEQEEEMKNKTTITIVYDNNRYDNRLTTAWGFSCVVKSPQRTILFDTGGDGTILLHNMSKLNIDPKEIDVVVLSHVHGDHIGGLTSFLKCNSNVTVYMPVSFPQELKDEVPSTGAKLEEVDKARELFDGVFTSGELDGSIKEQSLALRTPKGLVLITGCAHPGIANIAKKASEITGEKIFLMIGGFHLGGALPSHIGYVAESLLQLGVEKVAPCHCSGEVARRLFSDYFGHNYIECGIGKEVVIE
jgi:7,8-dihydropterin-6-yl-methyl-4-(beta-D-ribofuranosyl)aminobenzene 5'-phosphate synthase